MHAASDLLTQKVTRFIRGYVATRARDAAPTTLLKSLSCRRTPSPRSNCTPSSPVSTFLPCCRLVNTHMHKMLPNKKGSETDQCPEEQTVHRWLRVCSLSSLLDGPGPDPIDHSLCSRRPLTRQLRCQTRPVTAGQAGSQEALLQQWTKSMAMQEAMCLQSMQR